MRVSRVSNVGVMDQSKEEDLSLLDSIIEKFRNKKGNIIPILQAAQDIYGYLPSKAFKKISNETGIKLADMYGVATFYAQFRLNPVGKNIVKICHGTACHVQNAKDLTNALEDGLGIKDGETTEDSLFTLESVACLGCCSLAPVMMIGDETYGNLDGKAAGKIIKKLKKSEAN